MHSTLQTWATEVVRVARTRLISHFAAARFAGSGAATAAAAPLAQTCSLGCCSPWWHAEESRSAMMWVTQPRI
jgi:hypothetical protein